MANLIEFSELVHSLKTTKEISMFFDEILTETEINVLSKRWSIVKMLSEGQTQRKIALDLNVGLCKVTRGAKILKNEKSIIKKYLKEKNGKSN